MGEWQEKQAFDSWEDFRDSFYYPKVVGRRWSGVLNKKPRFRDQSAEQVIHDLWRKKMGFDAPWTDAMMFYDRCKVIALGEIKNGGEGWGDANRRAVEDAADRLHVPLLLIRFWKPTGPIEVTVYS